MIAYGGSASLPRCQFVNDTNADQESAEDSEIAHVPNDLIGDLHRQQGYQEYERRGGPGHHPPSAPAPADTAFRVFRHCLTPVHELASAVCKG